MEKSLFYTWLEKLWGPTITAYVTKVNGLKEEKAYLFMSMLQKKFSVNLKWGSLNTDGRTVAADVVALDSSIPLKRRDSFKALEGDIPKLGLKYRKSEQEMQDLQILEATNTNGNRTPQILRMLFDDPNKVIKGIYEKLEYMFLEAVSTGATTISEDVNEGTAVRISFGFNDANRFGVNTKWSDPNAKPISDIEHILDKASKKGRTPMFMMLDRASWNNFKSKAEVRELYAASIGFAGSNTPTPTMEQINNALTNNGMPQIVLIDKSVNVEKNGIRKSVKPWATGVVAFVESMDLGDLTYGTLVEANNPKQDVLYAQADDYILVSTYHSNDPFSETTSSQALVLPVINNVDGIYLMNTEESTASEDAQTEGDAVYTYKGTNYTKQSVVDGLNATDEVPPSTTAQQDATLASKIDKLSEEGVATFEAELVPSV